MEVSNKNQSGGDTVERIPCEATSSDGVHTLRGVIYMPKTEPRGYFQIVHGMAEHIGRYEGLMTFLAEAGWIAFGYDHLGHGHTAAEEERGFIAEKDGWQLMIRDVSVFYEAVRMHVGREDLPYCLMGHSMGSFVVRLAVENGLRPDRLIVMGTGGPNGAAGIGLVLIALIKKLYGAKHVSKTVLKLAFGGYNKRFKNEDPGDETLWLTSDPARRSVYTEDELCGFPFTVSAMGDLIRMTKTCNRSAWARCMPKDLPVLLISGRDDPVGSFGKGVETVYRRLCRAGIPAECVLFDGARHEILNEFTCEETMKRLLEFAER